MLEGVAVELCVVVEVIGVCKEVIARTEDITAADIGAGQSDLLGAGDLEAVLRLAVECFAHFVAKVGIGVLVTDDLHGVGYARGAVVGGEYDLVAQ